MGNESALERPGKDLRGDPDYTYLFSDPKAEAMRYVAKTGVYPPQHTTAVRENILQEHPGLR